MKYAITMAVFVLSVLMLANGASAWGYWGSSTCTDTDGKDFFSQGTVTYRFRDYNDRCYGSYVKEYFCSYNRLRTTYFRCPDGCSGGACVDPTPQIVCGNGIVEAGEQCDDGNTQNGDGCSSTCQIQCAENWQCTGWSACNSNNYKSRSCSDLNSCGTTYNKPSTYTKCRCYNTWVWEAQTVDIGNPTSETEYNLLNWGPIEPDTHGGSWGKSSTGSSCCPYGTSEDPVAYDGSTRVVSSTGTGDSASMEVKFGALNFYNLQQLEFMALKGISGNDSFDVYMGDQLIYTFVDDGSRVDAVNGTCPENWVKHQVDIEDAWLLSPLRYEGSNMPNSDHFYAVVNLTFDSTAPHWAYYGTYGQVAVSELTAKWKHNIRICE